MEKVGDALRLVLSGGDAYLSLLRCSNAGGNATTFCR